jgi:hypothetical protein
VAFDLQRFIAHHLQLRVAAALLIFQAFRQHRQIFIGAVADNHDDRFLAGGVRIDVHVVRLVPSLPLWSAMPAGRVKLSLPSSRLIAWPLALLSAAAPTVGAFESLLSQAASPITSRPIPTYLTKLRIDIFLSINGH